MNKTWLLTWSMVLALALGGCSSTSSRPTAEELAKRQRTEHAQKNLAEGQRFYADGAYKDAVQHLTVALDSGALPLADQLIAHKHMAFIHCITNNIPLCREEFNKAVALSDEFDLLPAEAGHPIWGPVFRVAKAGKGNSPDAAAIAASEKAFNEGMRAYDAANYNKAIASLQKATDPVVPLETRINAHKHIAFSYCLSQRKTLCRKEFGKLLQLQPGFILSPAEAGHPSWAPSFQAEKKKQQQASAGK